MASCPISKDIFRMKEYELGNETDSLETIYKSMLRFTPVKDGKCYFDEIQGGK